MKVFKSFLFGLFTVSLLFLASCSPSSKEAYLEEFTAFIDEVSADHDTYTAKDWKKAREKYSKFSGDWYDKFESEMSITEKAKVKALQAKCLYYSDVEDALQTVGTIVDVVKEVAK